MNCDNYNFFNLLIKKMAFTDYINSLPNIKADTINRICELTCSDKSTVYRWLGGTIEPPLLKKKIIAEYLHLPVEDLFPKSSDHAQQH